MEPVYQPCVCHLVRVGGLVSTAARLASCIILAPFLAVMPTSFSYL